MAIPKLFVAVLTLAVAVAFSGVPAVLQPVATLEAQAPRTAKLKGTLKSLDASSAVIASDNKNGEIVFQLTETTERSGALEPGEEIEVVYYIAQAKRVATQLIGKDARN